MPTSTLASSIIWGGEILEPVLVPTTQVYEPRLTARIRFYITTPARTVHTRSRCVAGAWPRAVPHKKQFVGEKDTRVLSCGIVKRKF